MSTQPPKLHHVANLTVIPSTPHNAGNTPRGRANWIAFSGGSFTTADGQHIAIVLPGGGDYATRYMEDNLLEVDLRVVAQDHSGTLFRLTSTGYDYLDDGFMQVLDGKAPPEKSDSGEQAPDYYGFEVVHVNTSSPEYRWMNFSVLLGQLEFILGEKGVESIKYKLYRVSK
jgi:hypothetical protein